MSGDFSTIFKNEYLHITHSASRSLFHSVYTEVSRTMTDETYKTDIRSFLALAKQYQPKGLLADTVRFDYVIVPEIQAWQVEEVFPAMAESGIKKFAIVVPDEIFALVSIQQAMDEDHVHAFETRYFKTEEQAFEWLAL